MLFLGLLIVGKILFLIVLCDLPAVYDTLDHTMLLDRLCRYFGFSHTVLRKFLSILLVGYNLLLLVTQHLVVGD